MLKIRETRNQRRKTYWPALLIPAALLLLGFALGWFIRPVAAAPAAAYLDPVDLVKLMPVVEPAEVVEAVPEPTPTPELLGTFRATAYCNCTKCCGKWAKYHLTASGTTPEEGRTVAADWAVLPAGTVIYIEGMGERVVEDHGSGVDGQALDIYFERHEDAVRFGVREVEVYVDYQ